MPHVIIKLIKGPSKEQEKRAAEQIAEIVNKTLGKPMKYISVSVGEYGYDEWPAVYDADIKGKNNVVVKPGYTDPKTFQ